MLAFLAFMLACLSLREAFDYMKTDQVLTPWKTTSECEKACLQHWCYATSHVTQIVQGRVVVAVHRAISLSGGAAMFQWP